MSAGRADSYGRSGVSLEAADRATEAMKASVRSTYNSLVLSDVGSFGGMFRASFPACEDPILVASTDGVGTKLRVASMAGDYSTVGRDLVSHCVNDILVQGARPLFFLDYIACGKLDPSVVASIVEGLAGGCRDDGCVLLGGETAEMPGFYGEGDYDVAGTIVGLVDAGRLIDGRAIVPGDILLGLGSSGLHTNGYSLARKVLLEEAGLSLLDEPEGLGASVGEALLRVHRSYLHSLLPLVLQGAGMLKGLAHVTGGGIPGNLGRILPAGCGAVVETGTWRVPPVFELIERLGGIHAAEMHHVFNMGIGMVAVVDPGAEAALSGEMRAAGEEVWTIGKIVAGEGVRLAGLPAS
ncbi:phosphoribosylformylglycinamidine cyclo-ligase [Candidatus Fermentibacterales bacterium]|nr:phosphoribosylformylglycinamidine cyclo-ligase [Candidatus Fermentibacterales bacterium]